MRLKRLSIRNKAWFRVLNQSQRRFMDALMKTVDKVRSFFLLGVLAPLVRRLLMAGGGDARGGALALKSEDAYKMMKKVAEKIVQTAQKWGNRFACKWLDRSFMRSLMIMNLPQNNNSAMSAF